jgi:DNA-binding NarL/FixJ family response regulator
LKLLLVDDHTLVRRGIRNLLAEALSDVEFAEASTGEGALALVRRGTFELVILDISMPQRGGIEVLKDLRAVTPGIRVLMLSQHAEEQYAIRALKAGAGGYLTKDCAPEELVRAVIKCASGGKYVSERLAERLLDVISGDAAARPIERLSDRELEVLRLIGKGRAVKEIAAELALSEKTVSTYRARLLEKTALDSNGDLMRYALGCGLVE